MKLAICIELDPTIKKLINFLKNNLKTNFLNNKNLYYFDHEPHITICCFNSNNTKDIIYKLEKFKFENINTRIQGISKFVNDPSTKGTTIYLKLSKTKKIISFQKKVLSLIKNNIERLESYNKFSDEYFKYNISKYKYPFVDKEFIPHITIGSLPNYDYLDELSYFSDIYINYNISFDTFQIVDMKNNGHNVIKRINIKK